ncbi:class I SAM-dependent methyltransferase [Reichenbachiella sp. MALMAid0571]|uniref:O-methyltransferase n=1 Tax=Reichenbachiella sp. MALMAid0571 TaxID=3143939 RepID=UPI0032DFCD4A
MDDHSLHSPFIFGFYRDVVKSDCSIPGFSGIEKVRDNLLNNTKEINVLDLGAGSSATPNTRRKISDIARYALAPAKNSRLYYRIIESIGAETVLELGTSLGINTMYLAAPSCVKKLVTIEGCPETASIAKSNFSGFSNSNIQLINEPIDQALASIFNRVNTLNLILFDANHTYEATMRYYHQCKHHINEQSVLIFDDIHWSKEMTKAWEEIKLEIEVTLTIDLFDMGIVFFKKELEKEDYVLNW